MFSDVFHTFGKAHLGVTLRHNRNKSVSINKQSQEEKITDIQYNRKL